MTNRVFPPSTWFRGWSYINPEVELLAGGFAFDLGVIRCHHLVRWKRRQGVSLLDSGAKGWREDGEPSRYEFRSLPTRCLVLSL